jgi:putative component of membrane protein insertase Oxa1/YidC/SpoIIIJ protein YidD
MSIYAGQNQGEWLGWGPERLSKVSTEHVRPPLNTIKCLRESIINNALASNQISAIIDWPHQWTSEALSRASILFIRFYRARISRLKPGKCAYGMLYGTHTCSAYGLHVFSTENFSSAVKLMLEQFDACKHAAKTNRNVIPHACEPTTCCCLIGWLM